MKYEGKLYGRHAGKYIPLVMDAQEVDRLKNQNEQLKEALLLACQWGIHADGHSAEVSDNLRVWVLSGMKGDAPKAPDYYPKGKYGKKCEFCGEPPLTNSEKEHMKKLIAAEESGNSAQ